MKIKRAFQLSPSTKGLKELKKCTIKLKQSIAMLESAKIDMQDTLFQREELINSILLKKGYIVSRTDRVVFLDQINKIFIYDSPEIGKLDETD